MEYGLDVVVSFGAPVVSRLQFFAYRLNGFNRRCRC